MELTNLQRCHLIIDAFKKTIEQCVNIYSIENINLVHDELHMSLTVMSTMCKDERELKLFAIPKEKEESFKDYYNSEVIECVKNIMNVYRQFHIGLMDFILSYENDLAPYEDVLNKKIDFILSYKNDPALNEDTPFNKKMLLLAAISGNEYSVILDQVKTLLENIKSIFYKTIQIQDNTIYSEHDKNISHRKHAIVAYYKAGGGYLFKDINRVDIKNTYGKRREEKYDTVMETSKNYQAIEANEIESIMPYLKDFPMAAKLAQEHWNKLTDSY